MEYPPLSGGPYGYARDDLAVVLRRFSGNGSPRPSARELFQLTETTKRSRERLLAPADPARPLRILARTLAGCAIRR